MKPFFLFLIRCLTVLTIAIAPFAPAAARPRDGCEATAELMRKIGEQLRGGPEKDDLTDILQRLKYVTTEACPNDGDAWFIRGKVEEKLGLSSQFSMQQARQYRSAMQKAGADPFSGGSGTATPSSIPNSGSISGANNDRTPPTIDITEPRDARGVSVKVGNQIRIAGTASDSSGLRAVTVHGISVNFDAQGAFSAMVPLNPQDQQVTVVATDNAGNSASRTISVTRDLNLVNIPVDPVHPPAIEGEFHALLIAVQKYDHPTVKSLDQPILDAKRFKEALTRFYTFEPKNISTLENPTSEQLINELDRLANVLRPEDHLLVFYAGHGHWDKDLGQGYWLPRDAEAGKRSKWISNSTLRDYIRGIKARHTLLITDACFSGGIFQTRSAFAGAPPSIKQLFEMPSRTAMTSGTLTEVPDRSIFLDHLLKRLMDNRDPYLTASNLFNSFREAVINNSPVMKEGQRTTPQYGNIQETGHEGGDFIFVRRPKS